jgi:uncharacterized membrane protein/glutaredoxin
MSGTYLAHLLFLLTGALGAVYLLIEAVLQSLGRSICASEGCRVVSQYSRFGDLSMVLAGLAAITVVTALAARGLRTVSAARDRTINIVLVAALAGEGFLAGYQLFRLHTVCIFCLSVLGIYVVLGLFRVLAGHPDVLAGFAALFAVLGLFYVILPAGGTPLPLDHKYVLFYSPDCKHCSEIRLELERQRIEVQHVEVKEHAATLKNLGIEAVPTLLVTGPYEKVFLTGTDAIRRYLSTCGTATSPPAARRPKTGGPRPVSPAGSGQPEVLNFFPAFGAPGSLLTPTADDGLCRENTKCE